MPALSIEDYGIIGNYTSSALINRLGAIDWCCLPYLDSPSHFGAILDQGVGGKFQLRPQGDFRSEQRYLQRSLVLETLFETPFGRAVLTDWMPLRTPLLEPLIYRKIEVLDGTLGWTLICDPHFDYGETRTEVEVHGAGQTPGQILGQIPGTNLGSSPEKPSWHRKHLLFRGEDTGQIAELFSSLDLSYSIFHPAGSPCSDKKVAEAKFTLSSGKSAFFAWSWGRRIGAPDFPTSLSSPQQTAEAWRQIAHHCAAPGATSGSPSGSPSSAVSGCLFAGPWHDTVVKTGLFLRLLVTSYAGSVAEAVTTSLTSGDRRCTWIRNSAFTLQALASLGMRKEAENYFEWLSEIIIRDGVESLQAVYTLDGGKIPAERELKNLKGFQGAFPVRIGSDAASRFHLDIYGHVALAADFYQREWGTLPAGLWPRLKEIADLVSGAWRRPDHGPWDNHEKAEHYVTSKALCWSTLDRACAIARRLEERPSPRWEEERKTLHRTLCEQGFDSTLNSFVRSFGDKEIDSSTLILPLIGFLPSDDPRIRGTLDAIMNGLSEGVLIRRGPAHPSQPPHLTHLWSSFLLVVNLALSGQIDDASDRMAELCSFATHLGFFGEQVNTATEETSGNFPSSSAHLALINAALYIGAARGRTLPIRHLLGSPEPAGDLGKRATRKIA